jgi:hypothetical protein
MGFTSTSVLVDLLLHDATFQGTILGVRIGETAGAALLKVRRSYPGARVSETKPYWTPCRRYVSRVDHPPLRRPRPQVLEAPPNPRETGRSSEYNVSLHYDDRYPIKPKSQ